jgi:hypothetical protein
MPGDIRSKFYNKFIQSLEGPSVRDCIGSHTKDWINNPEEIPKQSIEGDLDTGRLILEVTYYKAIALVFSLQAISPRH